MKNFRAILFAFIVLFGRGNTAMAQEMLGVAADNFGGQMGIDMNPASIVGAPYKWEIHVFSTDAAVMNNFMYLKQGSKLIRNSFKGTPTNSDQITDNYNTKDKWAYSSTFFKYPGFIWVDKKFSLAFSASTRLELSANNVPYHVAKFIKEGFDYDTLQGIDFKSNAFTTNMLNWHELSLTAGMVVNDDKEYYSSTAITFKYNYGLSGLYVDFNGFDYNSMYDSLLIIDNIDLNYGHAMPDNGENGLSKALKRRGKGYSFTWGYQLYKNRNDQFYQPCSKYNSIPYDYKIGFTLMDIGYIKYNQEARTFDFDNMNTDWYGIDTVKFDGSGKTDSIMGKQFYGVFMGARDKREFTLLTPGAISVQADVPLRKRCFANLTVIQRLPLGDLAIKRMNEIGLSLRYEVRRFSAFIPISFVEYQKVRVGLAVRWAGLSLGTDVLGPMLGITDTYGANFYIGWSLRKYPSCNGRRTGKLKKPSLENCLTPNK